MDKKNINDSNIFDDFSNNLDLKKEINNFEKEKNKDVFYYISIIGAIISYINVFLLIILSLFFTYTYIQNNQEIKDSSWLDPFCNFFLGDIPLPEGATYCSSITYVKKYYENLIDSSKKNIYGETNKLASDLYQKIDFSNSKDLLFILDKSKSRMKPLELLDEFDKLKNEYELLSMYPSKILDKKESFFTKEQIENFDKENLKIKCSKASINKNYELELLCEVKVKGWNDSILGFSGQRNYQKTKDLLFKDDKDALRGSINTLLSSFINYIEINSEKFDVSDTSYNYEIKDNISSVESKIDLKLVLKFKDRFKSGYFNL